MAIWNGNCSNLLGFKPLICALQLEEERLKRRCNRIREVSGWFWPPLDGGGAAVNGQGYGQRRETMRGYPARAAGRGGGGWPTTVIGARGVGWGGLLEVGRPHHR